MMVYGFEDSFPARFASPDRVLHSRQHVLHLAGRKLAELLKPGEINSVRLDLDISDDFLENGAYSGCFEPVTRIRCEVEVSPVEVTQIRVAPLRPFTEYSTVALFKPATRELRDRARRWLDRVNQRSRDVADFVSQPFVRLVERVRAEAGEFI